MKTMIKSTLCFGLSALFSLAAHADNTAAPSHRMDALGDQAVAELYQQYYDTANACRSGAALNCTGVMLRAVEYSPAYHSWDPSPKSRESGGVSFSWLREDSTFNKLAFKLKAGFLAYPKELAPKGATPLEVKCFFPQDGYTDERSNAGCGQNRYFPIYSQACQDLGVRYSSQWVWHYRRVAHYQRRHQCGFDLTRSPSRNAHAFKLGLRAQLTLGSEAFAEQNELRVSTWTTEQGVTLPLQAFFYTEDAGRDTARNLQQDYCNTTGRLVPVVRMTLPATMRDDVDFTYATQDQAVLD